MAPIIEVEDLWHTYPGEVIALKGVDLEIQQGEAVAIIGQNGSGKTTLVKHFNGLLKPTKGRVLVEGVDTRTLTTARLSGKVGYVFQNPNHQICCGTVEEELAFGLKNLKKSKEEIDKLVEKALETFGLAEFRKRHPYDLTLAQKKVLGIASIHIMKPKVLVLDEPTTGQDHVGIQLIKKIVEDIKKEGFTSVIITHDMSLVAECTPRAVVLWEGKKLLDGPTRNIFDQPEVLAKTFLSPPQITELSQVLSQSYDIPRTVLTVPEMRDILLRTSK